MQPHQTKHFYQNKPFKTYLVTIQRGNEESIEVELFAKSPGELHQFLSEYWGKPIHYTFVEVSEEISELTKLEHIS